MRELAGRVLSQGGAAKSQTLQRFLFFSPPPTGTPALSMPVLPGEDVLPGSGTAFVPACTLGAHMPTMVRLLTCVI